MTQNVPSPGNPASRTALAEWLLTFAVLAVFALNFFPTFARDSGGLLWGVHLYSYFPPLFPGLAFGLVILLLFPGAGPRLAGAFDRLSGRLAWRERPALSAALAGAAFFSLCLLFYSGTNFLGDGRILLRNIEEGVRFYPSDLVDFFLHRVTADLLGSGSASYRLISALAGGMFAALCYYLVRSLLDSAGERLLGLLWLLSTGAVIQFFGYVESYALFIVALQAYLLLALKYFKDNSSSVFLPSLLASLCCCLHPTGVIVLPSLGYLIYSGNGEKARDRFVSLVRFSLPALLGLALPPAGITLFFHFLGFDFGKLFSEAAARGSVFLPLWPSPESGTGNWAFSVMHFKDLLNLVLLVSPALVFLPFLIRRLRPAQGGSRSRIFLFLVLLCGAYALFFFMMDYKLALFRDWDLFSVPAPLCAVLALFLLAEKGKLADSSRLLRYLALNLLALAPFLALNAGERRALERFEELSLIAELHPRPVERAHNYEELAIYYRDSGAWEKAADYYRMAIALQPNYRYYAYLGYILQQQGLTLECQEAYEQSLRLEPDYYPVLYNLGNIYLQVYRPAEAVRCLEKAAKIQPTDREFVRLGQAYHQADSLDKAIRAFERAISLNPEKKLTSVRIEIAEMRMEAGDYQGSLADVKKIMSSDPDDPFIMYVLGNLCLRTGSLDAALTIFTRLKDSQSGQWEPHAGLGQVMQLKGRGDQAREHFESAIRNLPANRLGPHFRLARLLVEAGRYALAEKVYRGVLEFIPGHLGAAAGLARLWASLGYKEQAVGLLEGIEQWNRGSAEYWHNLGLAYLAAGRKEPAAACLDSLSRLEPDSPQAQELRGRLGR